MERMEKSFDKSYFINMTEEELKNFIDDVVDYIFTDYDHKKFNIIYDCYFGSITLEYKFHKNEYKSYKEIEELKK